MDQMFDQWIQFNPNGLDEMLSQFLGCEDSQLKSRYHPDDRPKVSSDRGRASSGNLTDLLGLQFKHLW